MDRSTLPTTWFPGDCPDDELTPAEEKELERVMVLARIFGVTPEQFLDEEDLDWEHGLEHLQ